MTPPPCRLPILLFVVAVPWVSTIWCSQAFVALVPPSLPARQQRRRSTAAHVVRFLAGDNQEQEIPWTSDFDGWEGSYSTDTNKLNVNFNTNANDSFKDLEDDDDSDTKALSELLSNRAAEQRASDLSAIRTRQFSLGPDLVLSDYVGNLGFEEVTDWEYYYEEFEDDDDEYGGGNGRRSGNAKQTGRQRRVVQPNPFDASQPRRTRTSSGSVVRLFRGEFVGVLGGLLGSQGLDRRVLVKEYFGDTALSLAERECAAVARLQSELVRQNEGKGSATDDWNVAAGARSVQFRTDNARVASLVKWLQSEPYVGILGEVNLAELEGEWDPNEFYRALKVPPPQPGAIWIVYEYAGLSSVQAYTSQPPERRRASLPPQRGFLGAIVPPPPLPSFEARANYVVRGILKGAIEAVAQLHDNGLVHRSIGRSSVILSSPTMDKRQASSPLATAVSQLTVKLTDFGFSGPYRESADQEDFRARARTFGLSIRQGGGSSLAAANFAMAEDWHALGFVALGLLLTALSDASESADTPTPATDEDSLQRLLSDIFDKDFEQFRAYLEADDAWTDLVAFLDRNDGAGWSVLQSLVLARETAAKAQDTQQILSIHGLLSSPFFAS